MIALASLETCSSDSIEFKVNRILDEPGFTVADELLEQVFPD